jgi:hypothetical protein
VVLVPTRSLIYTSSGKLSRSAAKTQYLGGSIQSIHPGPETPVLRAREDRLAVAAGE